MNDNQPQQKKSTGHIFLLCLLLFGIPAGLCIYKGELVTGIALATVGLSCYLGYRTGAIRALAPIGGIAAAIYFAPQWLPTVEPLLFQWFSFSGLLNRIASLGVIGLGCILVCLWIGKLFSRFFVRKNGSVDGLNRWGGLLMMGGEAVAGIALLLGGIVLISPEGKEAVMPESATFQQNLNYQLDVVAAQTRSESIGRVLEKHNPFVKFPQLNKFKEVQQTVRTISDPAAMNKVISHPRIRELQANQSIVQIAITELQADEKIQAILGSGEPLDREKVMALLNSQVLMDLLDQPAFVDEASKIIQELNLSEVDSVSFEGASL